MKTIATAVTAAVAALALASPIAAQTPEADIHAVDFRNFTYTPSCDDGKPVRTKDGTFTFADAAFEEFTVRPDVVYGDLTGDGRDEAIVVGHCRSAGSLSASEAYVFTMRAGEPRQIAVVEGGDRADGAIHTIRVRAGRLVVERYGGSALCCPEYVTSATLRRNGSRFVPDGPSRRYDYVASEADAKGPHRLRFARGAASAGVAGDASAPVEYVVGARAGQTATIELTTANGAASARILAADGRELGRVASGGAWTGRAPASGDLTIAVDGDEGHGDVYTLEIAIR